MANSTKKIAKLYSLNNKTVFTTADLMLLWNIADRDVLLVYISRYVKSGYLLRIMRGVYALPDVDVNIYELSGKMKKGTYISFETVLGKSGVIHQWYDELFMVDDINDEIINEYGIFVYRALPEAVLLNKLGIINTGSYFIATAERALCDKVYKDGLVYFDDVSALDITLLKEISKIYNNKRLERDIKKIVKSIEKTENKKQK